MNDIWNSLFGISLSDFVIVCFDIFRGSVFQHKDFVAFVVVLVISKEVRYTIYKI